MDYAQDGDLDKFDDVDISIGAEWGGEASDFVDALVTVGFLERDGNVLKIHDWYDYAGKLIDRRAKNAARMRDARASTEEERATHVQRTLQTRVGLPNQTIPNQPLSPAEPKEKNTYPIEFEEFWRQYPSGNGAKNKTFDQWKRLNPDDELRREIMDGLAKWNASKRWADGYVKSAEIWVRDRMWENPPAALRKSIERGNGERVV